MRWALALVAAAVAQACLPEPHALEGRACNEVHPCPAPLHCVEAVCRAELPDAGEPDGGLDSGFVATVVSLEVIDALTRQPLPAPYSPLAEGTDLPMSAYGSRGINLRANLHPERVTSVDFSMFGALRRITTENNFPYFMFGDLADGGLNSWRPDAGTYRLQVTPFVGTAPGETAIVTFTVTR